jgi:23S rRNA (cytidine1920-2'-O)/16S rRNA (cytidine1409-2'-O)-methyltransferase
MTSRQRADRLLVERGLFESRAQAQAAIAAGLVTADGAPVRKASDALRPDAETRATPAHPWVSRGGVKLAAALDAFTIDPAGQACLDVGASTGGFTDVLLARGARLVHAIDVGRDQLHPRLGADPRVVSREATDIRALAALDPPPSLIVADVSFISLRLVLPPALRLAAERAHLVALIKPQFEAGRAHVKKGIVTDAGVRQQACDQIRESIASLGWIVLGLIPSPIAGGDGNQEFLIAAHRAKHP